MAISSSRMTDIERTGKNMPQVKTGTRARFLLPIRHKASRTLSINALPNNGCTYSTPRTETLRKLLDRPGILLGPAAYDGISAKLTESAGFDFGFMSGFSVAGARLGLPDTGLVSYGEMVEQGRQMIEATSTMPLIGDGDTGHGNAMNVIRTVQGYAHAGFSGILIEDQVWPKSCGHVRGKQVIPRDEAIARIQAACDARKGNQDIVIVARTDAKQAVSFEEALERAQAFADQGADVVFIDALETVAEMRTFCARVAGAHKMANMLEGGGKTPILKPQELEEMGFKLVAYPLSLLGVSIRAMQDALVALKRGDIPNTVPEFSELQDVVGFTKYFSNESIYAVSNEETPRKRDSIEPDVILDPNETYTASSPSPQSTYDVTEYESSRSEGTRRSKWLRFKIVDSRNGDVKLDTRFPAGFLDGIASIVPQVSGIDLGEIMKGKSADKNEPAFSFEADGDTIQIFVEEQ